MDNLQVDEPTMTVADVREFKATMSLMANPVNGVPVDPGYVCTQCEYCSLTLEVMKDHLSNHHRGTKWSEGSKECKVQMPFQGRFRKYMQIESQDEIEVEKEGGDWLASLKEDFNDKVGLGKQQGDLETTDLRLLGAFIAKTRWDQVVKGVDGKALVSLAAFPTKKDPLFNISQCAKRYINGTCKKLSRGNMIIRRKLMIAK